MAGEVREQALHHQSCGIRWQGGGGKAGGGGMAPAKKRHQSKTKVVFEGFFMFILGGEGI